MTSCRALFLWHDPQGPFDLRLCPDDAQIWRKFGRIPRRLHSFAAIAEVSKKRGFTMDLGIKGKRALVCASSKGLGRGCAEALAEAGVDLVMNARGSEALEATAQHIRDTYGVEVVTVATDVTTPEGQAEVLEAAGNVDILVTNAGGPPPGLWSDWEREDFIKALDANMLTPIALMKALLTSVSLSTVCSEWSCSRRPAVTSHSSTSMMVGQGGSRRVQEGPKRVQGGFRS